jgi:hypothetical protein
MSLPLLVIIRRRSQYYKEIRSKSLWEWYINTNIIFLGVIQDDILGTMDNVQEHNICTTKKYLSMCLNASCHKGDSFKNYKSRLKG